jgi:hypothetical protein
MPQWWIATVPKTVKWADFMREIADVETGEYLKNWPVRPNSHIASGDRLFFVHQGLVRGSLTVRRVVIHGHGFNCATLGESWPPGTYAQLQGPWEYVAETMPMNGFQGLRRFKMPGAHA